MISSCLYEKNELSLCFNPESPSEEIPSSSALKKTQSVVSEEINEILQKILMEQTDNDSSEDENVPSDSNICSI